MNNRTLFHSIQTVFKQLNLSKDTLRYYDRIGLLSPSRRDNHYREYTENDLVYLKYIQLLKFGQFSLSEIQEIIENRRLMNIDNLDKTVLLFQAHKTQLVDMITQLQKIVTLLDQSIDAFADKYKSNDSDILRDLILNLYDDIFYNKKGTD